MQYANHIGYSDVNPFEIVRRVSEKTIDIRAMDSEQDPTWKPEFVAGGFSAVCLNNATQRWIITSNPNSPVVRIRKHSSGVWKDKHGRRYSLSDAPSKFYDYNF